MGKIIAVCTSEQKGVQKKEKTFIDLIVGHGIDGDAHAGAWHRQVSLLSYEKIVAFAQKGVELDMGAFGENVIVEGIDLSALPVGTKLRSGTVEMEVTQIGKTCHHHCAIYHAVGDCIMPREGIFARVIAEGRLMKGDELHVV